MTNSRNAMNEFYQDQQDSVQYEYTLLIGRVKESSLQVCEIIHEEESLDREINQGTIDDACKEEFEVLTSWTKMRARNTMEKRVTQKLVWSEYDAKDESQDFMRRIQSIGEITNHDTEILIEDLRDDSLVASRIILRIRELMKGVGIISIDTLLFNERKLAAEFIQHGENRIQNNI